MERFVCECCCIELDNITNMEAHLAGKKHRRQEAILELRKEESKRSVYISGLPIRYDIEQVLREYFSKLGVVKNVISDKKRGRFAIVEFADASAAREALASDQFLNGRKLNVKEKRIKYPQPRNDRSYSKETDVTNERMTKDLLLKIRDYDSVEGQMIVLQKELCLSTGSLNIRENIRSVLHQTLVYYFPNSELYLFGSSANGFGFEGCDVDLHLKLPPDWPEIEDEKLTLNIPTISDVEAGNTKVELLPNSSKLRLMRKIIQHFIPDVKHVIYIPSQRCPILRFKYKCCGSELLCDLSIGKGISVRNTILLWVYRNLDSRVLLLVTTLRWWAKQQKLINSECKLTSYAFIFLVIFFLQTQNPPLVPTVEDLAQLAEFKCVIDGWDCSFCDDIRRIPRSSNKQSLEELLREFFHFYANFDYVKHIISPRFGHVKCQAAISSDSSYNEFKIGPICIQDPFILDRNIAGNFKEKYLKDLIAKFSHCEKLLGEPNLCIQDRVAALMKEIPEVSDVTEPVSFSIKPASKISMFESMDNLSEQQVITVWFKKICVLIKDILERALCSECEIIIDRYGDNKPLPTGKRSLSFCFDDEQQQKHFMRDSALQDRTTASNCPKVSLPSITDNLEQISVPYTGINNMGNKEDSEINNPTNSSEKCPDDDEMLNSEGSKLCSNIMVPSFQKSNQHSTNDVLHNENILLYMLCKVSDDIWHKRNKESKKHKLEKRDILDIEHDISQTIIKSNGNNKFFLFYCMLLKQDTEGIMNIKVEMTPHTKNSLTKLKQFIVPYVSKLADKCIKSF